MNLDHEHLFMLAMSGHIQTLIAVLSFTVLSSVFRSVQASSAYQGIAARISELVARIFTTKHGLALKRVREFEMAYQIVNGACETHDYSSVTRAVNEHLVDIVKAGRAPEDYRLVEVPWKRQQLVACSHLPEQECSAVPLVDFDSDTSNSDEMIYARAWREECDTRGNDTGAMIRVGRLRLVLEVQEHVMMAQVCVQAFIDRMIKEMERRDEEELKRSPRCFIMSDGDSTSEGGSKRYETGVYYGAPRYEEYDLRLTKKEDNCYFEGKAEILRYVDFFLREHDLSVTCGNDFFERTGMPRRCTMLLRGEPGTGKTSAVKMLARRCARSIKAVNPSMIRTPKCLREVMNSTYIEGMFVPLHRQMLVIEDIDRTPFLPLLLRYDCGGKNAVYGMDITRSDLLNAFDGLLEMTGLIIVATMNMKLEKLDDAFLRGGRLRPFKVGEMSLDDVRVMHRVWFGTSATVHTALWERVVQISNDAEMKLTQAVIGDLFSTYAEECATLHTHTHMHTNEGGGKEQADENETKTPLPLTSNGAAKQRTSKKKEALLKRLLSNIR